MMNLGEEQINIDYLKNKLNDLEKERQEYYNQKYNTYDIIEIGYDLTKIKLKNREKHCLTGAALIFENTPFQGQNDQYYINGGIITIL